jgi:hypothetical protein
MNTSHSSAPTIEEAITIRATFGSAIQREVSMRVLQQFLKVWQHNVEAAHRKNKVTITREE